MIDNQSPGARLRAAVRKEKPLQIVGTINAYSALLAQRAGFRALYLSGAGVANASYGLPDLGMTTMDNVLEDVGRITAVTRLPLLVDADTGFGSAFNIARTLHGMIRAGAGGIHIEDQVQAKRCGHRPGKALVSREEMADRIKAAVDARDDEDFVIMARTDALAIEGLEPAIERAVSYCDAGADMIFAEAVTKLDQYKKFTSGVEVPVLANLTEFGETPLYSLDELRAAGVALVLYPLSAFRAAAKAEQAVYQTIRRDGTQKAVLDTMQTRSELYEMLGYDAYERKLDQLFAKEKPS